MKRNICFFALALTFLFGCRGTLHEKGDPKYIAEINTWHSKRIENLKKESGWLNLVGLNWLHEGENKIGSTKSNDIIFPENAPSFIGTIILKDTSIEMRVASGINVTINGRKIDKVNLHSDASGKAELISLDSFRWNIIKRQDKIGIRLRDLNAPLVKNFSGTETFPINVDWKIPANFESYNPPKRIPVPNILGQIDTSSSSGAIVFEKDEKTFRLDALDEGDKLFIIFADETSGKETYGAGRFLYLDKPKPGEKFYIDFNKSYNPPCNFTKYATCPLPPSQNHLKLAVTAGEKTFKGGGH